MTATKKLLDLQTADSGCGDIRISSDGVALTLEYEYASAGTAMIGTIEFGGVVAHSFSVEGYTPTLASASFDAVVEHMGSPWAIERADLASDRGLTERVLRHFAVFLSGNGLLEVLASECTEGNLRRGALESD